MTRTILGFEFTLESTGKHSETWRCGNITLTSESDPLCWRAQCGALKSMWQREDTTALAELGRLADEMVQAVELMRRSREGKTDE